MDVAAQLADSTSKRIRVDYLLVATGRGPVTNGLEAERVGLYNRVVPAAELASATNDFARKLAPGPAFALGKTKEMLNRELDMDLLAALESEAQAQAICMQTEDFERAYRAFVAKQKPTFEGN